jgi:hypothetical protein
MSLRPDRCSDIAPISTYQLLRQAVLNLDSVAATYRGQPTIFSPHVLGSTRGEGRVLGYQFGGIDPASESNQSSGWCCFRIDDLSDLRLILGTWRTPAGSATPRPGRLMEEVDVTARLTQDLDQCDIDEAA